MYVQLSHQFLENFQTFAELETFEQIMYLQGQFSIYFGITVSNIFCHAILDMYVKKMAMFIIILIPKVHGKFLE